MGSRYDITVFRGATLAEFGEAFRGHGTVGAEVERPWAEPNTVAQIDTASGSNVVVVSGPMGTPDGVGSRLAKKLGAEMLFATVWDSVSHYALSVVGPQGPLRDINSEPSEDEVDDEGYGRIVVDASGERLPEEPDWGESDLSEAYVQHFFRARCGIDPGALYDHGATWHVLEPLQDGGRTPIAEEPTTPTPTATATPVHEPDPGVAGGLWSRVRRLFNG